jgi:hypothetical protein
MRCDLPGLVHAIQLDNQPDNPSPSGTSGRAFLYPEISQPEQPAQPEHGRRARIAHNDRNDPSRIHDTLDQRIARYTRPQRVHGNILQFPYTHNQPGSATA